MSNYRETQNIKYYQIYYINLKNIFVKKFNFIKKYKNKI